MFFEHMGYGGCYRGISVDPRFRQNDRPGNDCCDEDREHGRHGNNSDCGNGRPGGDFYPGDNCRPDNGHHPDNDCGSNNDNCRHDNNGCENNCSRNNCCDNEEQCTDGIRAVLAIAMRALGRDDTIDVEITLSGGYTQVVTLGRGTSTLISSDILRTPQGAVSLCEITRIRLLSSSVSDPEYMQRLQNELQQFIGRSMNRRPSPDCFKGDCDSCVEAMQRYIMRNSNDIEALLFDGSQSVTASAVIGTDASTVLAAASLESETASFVTDVELSTDTVEVITAVTSSETEVVSEVELLPTTLVSAVTTATTSVSAPVEVTEIEVAGSVDITEAADFASGLTVTEATVVGEIATETVEAVSGFGATTTVSGIVSGLDDASAVGSTAVNVPILNSVGSGALQVIIPAGAFGTNIPATDVTLPVTVDGIGISYGGTSTVYTLPNDVTLLSIAGIPNVSEIDVLGTPITTPVVSAVTATEATVAASVEFESLNGALVTDVTPVSVGSAAAPEIVEVVSTVTTEFSDINAVGTVSTVDASSLFTVDTASVLSGAQLTTTEAEGLDSAELTTTTASVISGITTTPVSVFSPTFAEPIEGDIIGARRGIIAVDNTDGDISVYSSCSVRGAQLETDIQP